MRALSPADLAWAASPVPRTTWAWISLPIERGKGACSQQDCPAGKAERPHRLFPGGCNTGLQPCLFSVKVVPDVFCPAGG